MNSTHAQDINLTLSNLRIALPSPFEPLFWPFASQASNLSEHSRSILRGDAAVEVFCKRDDLIHPVISGNKWRKLAPTVAQMQANNCQHVISFGGGHSNHLHALSYICHLINIKMTAIIRGDYAKNMTPMLLDLQKWQTNIQFVTKDNYKKRHQTDYCEAISKQFGADFVVPEGGSNNACKLGFLEMVNEIKEQLSDAKIPDLTHVIVPVASGGTMAGLVNAFAGTRTKIIGIAMLKGQDYLEELVENLLDDKSAAYGVSKPAPANWEILHSYHHGGYAKSSDQLRNFIAQFNTANMAQSSAKSPLIIEPVYSGKCFYALDDLLANQYFANNSKVMIVHTGGLQAAR